MKKPNFLIHALLLMMFVVLASKITNIQKPNGVHVQIQSQPDWCPPCRRYEPEIKKAFNSRELAGVKLTIVDHLEGGPDYVPFTLITSKVEECQTSIDGYVSAEVLKSRIVEVIECQKSYQGSR